MVEEFTLVISRKKFNSKYRISPITIQQLIAKLNQHCLPSIPPKQKFNIRDPKDIVVLATAISGHADYLVTGDQDLLVLAHNKKIKPLEILSPVDFIHL